MTNPSRSFDNGREASVGVLFRVDNADSSEKRIRASICTELSVPMQSATVSPPDGFDAELDCGRPRSAGRPYGDLHPSRAELMGHTVGNACELE
jgi:hypothetical protein